MTSVFTDAKRLVVKVGSSLVTDDGRGLDHAAVARWAEEIAQLKRDGREVVLVSSGAIAEGVKRLGWTKRPHAIHELQAAAAVGQMGLIQAYEAAFAKFGLHTAQILLTHDDLADRRRYLNARTTLRTLLELSVIPIVNENDTVTTDEIRVGDNDTLGALVANLIEADVLVLLTDQQGLYTADPRKYPQATFVGEARRAVGRIDHHCVWPRHERADAARGGRSHRDHADRACRVAGRAQAMARRSCAIGGQAASRRRCGAGVVQGRQKPAADRRDRRRR